MWKPKKKDERGFSAMGMVGVLIAVLIAVIIGFALSGTLLSQVNTVNSTADYPANSPIPGLINLTPLFWFLGIVITSIAIVFVALRASGGGA